MTARRRAMRRWRPPLPRAVQAATRVLTSRRIDAPEEIDLLALLDDFRIKLLRRDIGNAEGRLVRAGRRAVMAIDHRAFESEKWKFVLAHELGHFLLHAYRDELSCFAKAGADATRDDKSRAFLDEEAASQFAAELLAPASMVRRHVEASAPLMLRAQAIAQTFGVSLPVAALRALDFATHPCAVAYAEAGVVQWCTSRASFGVNVAVGAPVPAESVAASLDARAGSREATGGVAASAWGRDATGIEVLREHTVHLAPFDAVVTVLEHGDYAR